MNNVKCFLSTDDLQEGMHLYIYGTGTYGVGLKKTLEDNRKDVKILNFIDTLKTGTLDNTKIINPDELSKKHTNKDLILIATDKPETILKSLNKFQFDNIAILCPPELYCVNHSTDIKTLNWLSGEIKKNKVADYKTLKAIYELKFWSDNGFYHNIKLNEHYTTYSIGGKRKNRPLKFDEWCDVEWNLIYNEIKDILPGSKVVEAGPAEGYFSFKAAEHASKITIIHPPHYFMQNHSTLSKYFGVSKNFEYLCGLYPDTGQNAVLESDIVLFLGVLYHIENAQKALDYLTASRSILVIEGMFFEDGYPVASDGISVKFNPTCIDQSPKGDKRLCPFWLEKYLNECGYSAKWIDEWQKYVEQPDNLRHMGTRRLLVAYPDYN